MAEVRPRFAVDEAITERRYAELQRYWSEVILSPDRRRLCAHNTACEASKPADACFHYGTRPYLGPAYDLRVDGRPMRIAIVGMDWKDGSEHHDKTLDDQRAHWRRLRSFVPGRRAGETLNPHLTGTEQAIRVLLGLPIGSDPETRYLAVQGAEDITLWDVVAFHNRVLCAATAGPHGKKSRSTATMRANCTAHIRRFFDILDPTHVVFQGGGSADRVEQLLPGVKSVGGVSERHWVWAREGTVAMWFRHPSAPRYAWGRGNRPYFVEHVAPVLERWRGFPYGDASPARP